MRLMTTVKKFTLLTPYGHYEADGLLQLMWEVLRHRLSHLFQGDGWTD